MVYGPIDHFHCFCFYDFFDLWMFHPLGVSHCLLLSNSNDRKCISFKQGRFFHTPGNYFADEKLLFGRYNAKLLSSEE